MPRQSYLSNIDGHERNGREVGALGLDSTFIGLKSKAAFTVTTGSSPVSVRCTDVALGIRNEYQGTGNDMIGTCIDLYQSCGNVATLKQTINKHWVMDWNGS